MRRRWGGRWPPLTLLALAASLGAVAATARAVPVPLPSVVLQVTLEPPFPTPVTGGENEGALLRIPTVSDQRVTVRVDEEGDPFSVRVRQRLVVRRTGDYSFVIGAPVDDVLATPESESEPGLRRGAILWAGFSAGRKVLSADVVLRPREAARVLPLRIDVDRMGDSVRVRLRNATRVSLRTIGGNARPLDAARALDAVRRQGARPLASGVILDFRGAPVATLRTIAAPLHVRGTLEFPAGALAGADVRGGVKRGDSVAVDALLGDETPLVHDVLVSGTDAIPKLRVVATPEPPVRALEPPGGRSWADYVRGRKISGRALVARAVAARLAFARARQYQTLLSDPDPLGPRSATYRFITGERPPRATPQQPASVGAGAAWLPFVLVPLGLAVAAGLVVLWAHS